MKNRINFNFLMIIITLIHYSMLLIAIKIFKNNFKVLTIKLKYFSIKYSISNTTNTKKMIYNFKMH